MVHPPWFCEHSHCWPAFYWHDIVELSSDFFVVNTNREYGRMTIYVAAGIVLDTYV